MTHVTLLFDAQTLLQVGAVLMSGRDLIASYHFRDLRLNPRFDANHFLADHFK
jgi:outer membrane lipoprotein-sorting protein